MEEQPNLETGINADIDKCLALERIDLKMLMFIHIFEQVPDEISKELNLNKLRNDLFEYLTNDEFMSTLNKFYSITVNPDEARLLFDWNDDSVEHYRLINYSLKKGKKEVMLFSLINKINLEISMMLGKVKKEIRELDTEKYNPSNF